MISKHCLCLHQTVCRPYYEYQKQFEEQEAQRKGRIAPLDEKTIQSEQDIINSFIKMGLLNQPVEAAGLFDGSLTEAISKFHVYE